MVCLIASTSRSATATAQLTQAMVKMIVDSGLVPEGAISLICGGAGDLLENIDTAGHQTVVKSIAELLTAGTNITPGNYAFRFKKTCIGTPDSIGDIFVEFIGQATTNIIGFKTFESDSHEDSPFMSDDVGDINKNSRLN